MRARATPLCTSRGTHYPPAHPSDSLPSLLPGYLYRADQGGCWHASYWEVQKLVPYPSSAVYPNRKCPEEGWVKGFMKQINMLFPHPGHMFINNGWPAISHQARTGGAAQRSAAQHNAAALPTASPRSNAQHAGCCRMCLSQYSQHMLSCRLTARAMQFTLRRAM